MVDYFIGFLYLCAQQIMGSFVWFCNEDGRIGIFSGFISMLYIDGRNELSICITIK